MVVPIYNSINSLLRFPFRVSLTNTCCFLSFADSHSDRCEVILHCAFDLHFPDDMSFLNLFMCLLAICISLLKKCLFSSSTHFESSCIFFWCWAVLSFYIWIFTPYQIYCLQISSPIKYVAFLFYSWSVSPVQFSRSVMSDSLWPHETQHARPPCPWPTPGVHSDSHPLSWWCIQPPHPLSSSFPPAPNPS